MSPEETPFIADDLPKFDAPTVTLMREDLQRFRGRYLELLQFAAALIGKDVNVVCRLDTAPIVHRVNTQPELREALRYGLRPDDRDERFRLYRINTPQGQDS